MAIDPESKLIPSYFVGKRDALSTMAFMRDLSERLDNRIQLSADGSAPTWTWPGPKAS